MSFFLENVDKLLNHWRILEKRLPQAEYEKLPRYVVHGDLSFPNVLFNDKDQILLQKRSKNKDLNPGLYTISTSGHVDKGETYRQTAKRELSEELGIQIPIIQKKRFLAELGYETEMHCLFTARSNGPFYPDKNEVDKVKFVSKNELKKIKSKLTPSAKLSLKQLSLLWKLQPLHHQI